MKTVWIDTDSPRFPEWVELRQRVLRDPLGLRYSEEDLAAERDQRHLLAIDPASDDLLGGLAVADLGGDPKVWKIRQVAIAAVQQGRGIGRDLMLIAMQEAREKDVGEIILHSRADVVPFYEKLGFVVVGEEFLEVGIPHRKMVIRPRPPMG